MRRNFVYVLTDNIFDSHWCTLELVAAVENKLNIILLVKEGSRWKDADGLKTGTFPGSHIIDALPEIVRPIFTRKVSR